MMNKEDDKRIQSEIFKCTRCGKCRHYCPTHSVMKWDTYSPRGRLLLINDYIRSGVSTQDFIDRIYSCSLCKLCEEICPSHIDIQSIVESTRLKLTDRGRTPYPSHYDMIKGIAESGNVFNMHEISTKLQSRIDTLSKHTDTLFYVGCTGFYQYPELAINWIDLLKNAGIDFSILNDEYCCGGFLKTIGEMDRYKKIVLKNADLYKKNGIKKIITACPMCYSAFKHDYPAMLGEKAFPFEVQNIYEVLNEAVKNESIMLHRDVPIKISYHDPCHLGRWSGIYDAPRNLIKMIPKIKYIEMEKNMSEALCCGGPIRAQFIKIRNGMSEKIIENAYELDIDALVTACPTCYHNLRAAGWVIGIQVYELSELIAYSTATSESLQGLEDIKNM